MMHVCSTSLRTDNELFRGRERQTTFIAKVGNVIGVRLDKLSRHYVRMIKARNDVSLGCRGNNQMILSTEIKITLIFDVT